VRSVSNDKLPVKRLYCRALYAVCRKLGGLDPNQRGVARSQLTIIRTADGSIMAKSWVRTLWRLFPPG
jgi:hypothetical protein